MFKFFVAFACFFSVFAFVPEAIGNPQYINVSVKRIVDGDTIVAQFNQQNVSIRLACIDAPEMAQKPEGNSSRSYLLKLLPPGSSVNVLVHSVDRYNRIVGEVFNGNSNINLELIQVGQAVVYEPYLSCDRSAFLKAQLVAKQHYQGVWSNPGFMLPWEFRRLRRLHRSSVEV